MEIFIKNVKVFNPDQKSYVASLHLKDEKVFKIIKNQKEISDLSRFSKVIEGVRCALKISFGTSFDHF